MAQSFDFLIAGGGIIGLSLARELKVRHPRCSVAILEKESSLGRHASGRNSGVLHSGIFYGEDSLKARVCTEGAKELFAYCEEHRLPATRVGKVILPVNLKDDKRLDFLYEMGKKRGIAVDRVDLKALKQIEPEAYSLSTRALHLPRVAIVDPHAVLNALALDLLRNGVKIFLDSPLQEVNVRKKEARTKGELIPYGFFLNAAGLYADRIARIFDVGESYAILPFKGIYYRVSPSSELCIRGLIYAVPDPEFPFLGIHYAKNQQGEIFLGPTIIPCLGRENYFGLSGSNFRDSMEISYRLMLLFLANHQNFRKFAFREGLRMFKRFFFEGPRKLTPRLKIKHLLPTKKVGIRAQLVNIEKRELVMDFLIEEGESSVHVLNAVSPAFTSAFPFVRLVLDKAGI